MLNTDSRDMADQGKVYLARVPVGMRLCEKDRVGAHCGGTGRDSTRG